MKSNQKGFTLVELLAVLVILGIVLVIALQTYEHITENSGIIKYDYQWKLTKNAVDIYTDGMIENLSYDDCLIIDYNMLKSTDLLKEDDITCNGYALFIKDGNKDIYNDSLLKCYKENNKIIKYRNYNNENYDNDIEDIPKDLTIVYDTENNKSINLKQCVSMFDSRIKINKSTTNSISVTATCSSYDSVVNGYIYEILDSSGKIESYEWNDNTYIFNNLKDNTVYSVRTTCSNMSGKTSISDYKEISTKELKKPEINAANNNIATNNWYTKYTYSINFNTNNKNDAPLTYNYFKSEINGLDALVDTSAMEYIYPCEESNNKLTCSSTPISSEKLTANKWYLTTKNNVNITYEYYGSSNNQLNGNLKAKISDGNNEKETSQTLSFNGSSTIKIDSVQPKVSASKNISLSKYKMTVTCETGISGIKEASIECTSSNCSNNQKQISTSSPASFEYNVNTSSNSGTINAWYTHNIGCVSNNGKSVYDVSNINLNASITVNVNNNLRGIWTNSKSYTIEYTENGDLNLENDGKYFKIPYNGTVNIGVKSCGTGTMPSTCSQSTVTNVVAGNWYKLEGYNSIVYTVSQDVSSTGGTLYAIIGTNAIVSITDQVERIETTVASPIVSGGNAIWENKSRLSYTISSISPASGINHYEICTAEYANSSYPSSTCNDNTDSGWTSIGTSNSFTVQNANNYRSGAIYFRTVSNAGNKSQKSQIKEYYMDTGTPSITINSTNGKTVNFTLNDNVGLIGYGINQSTSIEPSYSSISGTSVTTTWTGSVSGTYYIWAKDVAGNVSYKQFSIKNGLLTEDNNGNGQADIGDLICISTECFYVYSNDGTYIKALARYNLYVGAKYDGYKLTPYGSEATGLQNYFMKGYNNSNQTYCGLTAFSYINNRYEGSIVEQYVNQYATKLAGMGEKISDVRLITMDELISLGCSRDLMSCLTAPLFITETTYYTGTAAEGVDSIWVVARPYWIQQINHYNLYYAGVRPVITIPVSEI